MKHQKLCTPRTHRLGRALGISVTLLLTIGCSSDDNDDNVCEDEVKTSVSDDGKFDSYKTFAIMDASAFGGDGGNGGNGGSAAIPDVPEDVQVNLDAANKEAVSQLKSLGLTEVDPDKKDPDLWVFSAAATEDKDGVYWDCVPGWYWWGWYYYWDACAWVQPIDFTYTVGTLAVGVIDAKQMKPVFGGFVQGILECSDDIDGRIQSGVDQIFEDYPQD